MTLQRILERSSTLRKPIQSPLFTDSEFLGLGMQSGQVLVVHFCFSDTSPDVLQSSHRKLGQKWSRKSGLSSTPFTRFCMAKVQGLYSLKFHRVIKQADRISLPATAEGPDICSLRGLPLSIQATKNDIEGARKGLATQQRVIEELVHIVVEV
jgi:hypothetical protein